MICVTVFAAQYGVITQTVFGILACLVALVLQLEKKPYKSDLLDTLETASLICCIATLQLGLLLVASHLGDAQYSEAMVAGISVLLVVLHACYILCWLIYFVPQARQMSGQVVQNSEWLQRVGDKVLRRRRLNLSMDTISMLEQPSRRRGPRNQTDAAVATFLTRLHTSWAALKRFVRTPPSRNRARFDDPNEGRRATGVDEATIFTDDGVDAGGFLMETRKPDRRETGVC